MRSPFTSAQLAASVVLTFACSERRPSQAAGELAQQRAPITTVCANGTTLAGVDVSDYDTVEWHTAADAGVVFGIAEVSDGLDFPDSSFAYNWAGMLDAGIIRGAYQYFEPDQDPTMQANLVVAAVGMLGPNDLPVTFDMEKGFADGGTPSVAAIHTWMSVIEAGTGKTPMIYTSTDRWGSLGYGNAFADLSLWVAEWGPTCPGVPDGWSTWQIWQWTATGTVGGVSSVNNSDLDVFNGDREALQSFAEGAALSCVGAAATCSMDTECCIGLACSSGTCQPAAMCTALWGACTTASQCCDGEACLTWTPSGQAAGSYCCDAVGASCGDSRDCCGGTLCASGTCMCVPENTYCQNDADCCGGLSCQSSRCAPSTASSTASTASASSSSTSGGASSMSATGSTGNATTTSTLSSLSSSSAGFTSTASSSGATVSSTSGTSSSSSGGTVAALTSSSGSTTSGAAHAKAGGCGSSDDLTLSATALLGALGFTGRSRRARAIAPRRSDRR